MFRLWRKRMISAAPAAMLAAAAVLVAMPAHAQGWQRYAIERHGVSFDFPSHVFDLRSAEDKRSGRLFYSPDRRARLAVFGFTNTGNDTPRSFLQKTTDFDAANFTYVRTTPSFVVASGTKAGRIFYRRCNFSHASQRVGCFQLDYPRAEKRRWDGLVTRISHSLRMSPSS
jgi:hypothetical protein